MNNCVICYEIMDKSHNITCTPCMHPFHTECIEPWLSSNRYNHFVPCPICKTDISVLLDVINTPSTDINTSTNINNTSNTSNMSNMSNTSGDELLFYTDNSSYNYNGNLVNFDYYQPFNLFEVPVNYQPSGHINISRSHEYYTISPTIQSQINSLETNIDDLFVRLNMAGISDLQRHIMPITPTTQITPTTPTTPTITETKSQQTNTEMPNLQLPLPRMPLEDTPNRSSISSHVDRKLNKALDKLDRTIEK